MTKKRESILFSAGRPFSPIYSSTMKCREWLYKKGIFKTYYLKVPVISIGNLVLGGTGKTPTVRIVAKYLQNRGYKPAIVSRGYRGEANEDINVISDGNDIHLFPPIAADEPYMLAKSLPGVPVLTGRRRVAPCCFAIENYGVDIIILDDGFQHLSLARNLNIVLFDGTYLAGNSRILPGGPLREPVAALKRSSLFLITGKTEKNNKKIRQFTELLSEKFESIPVCTASFSKYSVEKTLVTTTGNSGNQLKESLEISYFGFCGIANPERFQESLNETGISLLSFQSFKDHASYNQQLLNGIYDQAKKCGANRLITTEKDLVKIETLESKLPVYVLMPVMEIEEEFYNHINTLTNKQLRKEY